jgi:apolipoprotein D and lipocalin family protein
MGIFSNKFRKSTKYILPMCNIDLKRYLGTWYEIARLPNSFEKGLENITATYILRSDGKIEVINSGIKNGEKKIAKGVAWIPDKNYTGQLLVSFFWIFKSQYNIIMIDETDYSYSVVTSNTNNSLWILSRVPKINNELYDNLIKFVSSKGFDVTKIIKVAQ